MSVVCDKLVELISKFKFQIINILEDSEKCIIDFKHPKIELRFPYAYFLSSVSFNKKTGILITTIRSKVDTFKELFFLDYCCEDGSNVCRPHVDMEDKIFSVEAIFSKDVIKKFGRLLEEMI
jgi:hypothetical protein